MASVQQHPMLLTRSPALQDLGAKDLDGALGISGYIPRRVSTVSLLAEDGGILARPEDAAKITIITGNNKNYTTMDLNVSEASPSLSETYSPSSDTSPWVGGTGLGSAGLGKSGRVIERLMAENDRLRREMKAEMTKMEELQRTMANLKPRMDTLQADNARLTNTKTMDDNIILRRDRKIEELKAELDSERRKRYMAESRAVEAERVKDMTLEANRQELAKEREKARHATVHADILQTSHQQLSREYRQRIATTSKTLKDLTHDRDGDRKRLARLDIVCNQMRQETERMRSSHQDLVNVWQRLEAQRNTDALRMQASAAKAMSKIETRGAENELLADEMRKTMEHMTWAIRMEGIFGNASQASPPPSPPRREGSQRRMAVGA